MLVAVDSLGAVYFSLSQSNSNMGLFGIFLQQLVLKLDVERPSWRKNTLVTLDGAAYHRALEVRELFERLEIPVAMLGPYSYAAAPCELFFASFKGSDINPRKVPTTKGHFPTVLKLVYARCKQIPRQQLVLHWHHCMLQAYKYLTFERL